MNNTRRNPVRLLHRLSPLSGLALATAMSSEPPAFGAATTDYPNKPVRLIVPYPPGGGVDAAARLLAEGLAEKLGQQLVVDNRGGASGIIGIETAARSIPDGYTLLTGSVGLTSSVNFWPFMDLATPPADRDGRQSSIRCARRTPVGTPAAAISRGAL